MDSMLQKCVQYTGAYFKITLFGSIWALNLCNNCITTPLASRDAVITLKHLLYSRRVSEVLEFKRLHYGTEVTTNSLMPFDVWLTVRLNSVKITKPPRCHFV